MKLFIFSLCNNLKSASIRIIDDRDGIGGMKTSVENSFASPFSFFPD